MGLGLGPSKAEVSGGIACDVTECSSGKRNNHWVRCPSCPVCPEHGQLEEPKNPESVALLWNERNTGNNCTTCNRKGGYGENDPLTYSCVGCEGIREGTRHYRCQTCPVCPIHGALHNPSKLWPPEREPDKRAYDGPTDYRNKKCSHSAEQD